MFPTQTPSYQPIKVGVAGAAGYTGGELIRILLHHPAVLISWLHSNSQAGKRISDTHQDLAGEIELRFADSPSQDADVVFLCLGHGAASKYLQQYPRLLKGKVIDLSHDFRLANSPFLDQDQQPYNFVYGLTDAFRDVIAQAQYVANPGCFATAIQLALLPAAQAGALANQTIHINAVTGSTGAGQALADTAHFSWRIANHSVYKPFGHQHEAEILETIAKVSVSHVPQLRFLPSRGAFARGIFATTYFETDQPLAYWQVIYQQFYQHSPFVTITDNNPSLKQVVNTNKCILYLERHGNTLLIISMIDNLLKGASGQAVENMNLMFGLQQGSGLRLKGTGF